MTYPTSDRTNSRHLELYCVMGEEDNAGFPLSYCLLSTADSIEQQKRTKALSKWTKKLRDKWGVNPSFVHLDKDMAEIGMVRKVWPKAKIQLCHWHLKQAVQEWLAKTKLSTTPYNPTRAWMEFSFINVLFRPPGKADNNEYEGGFDYYHPVSTSTGPGPNTVLLHVPPSQPSAMRSDDTVDEWTDDDDDMDAPVTQLRMPGGQVVNLRPPREPSHETNEDISDNDGDEDQSSTRRTFCVPECREPILKMMENHLNAHPLIPGYSAPTKEGIREWAVKQMYEYCERNDLREVWAYLWENWYRKGRWELWARSQHDEIPRLKTTMIMESQ
jgi:hypothetical protein